VFKPVQYCCYERIEEAKRSFLCVLCDLRRKISGFKQMLNRRVVAFERQNKLAALDLSLKTAAVFLSNL
jgi:hypothetical protein